ncbi:MAG: Bug family tripartite tricarboxylate transporter substrate binding protein [Burkholderiales bacterium]
MKRRTLLQATSAAIIAAPFTSWAQNFPDKPIRFIVPYPPGGPLDASARALAETVRSSLGTVAVENRTGAGGNIGADAIAKAAPDGYTIGIGAVATHAINPWLFPKMPYDALADFTPITLIANVPNVLILNTDFSSKNNIQSVADLVKLLKARPGKINFGSGGPGSGGHLAGELFKQGAEVFMLHIAYRGAAPAQLGLLSGEVELMFDNLASAAPRIREGKVKALAVTTRQRSSQFPDLPTIAESGIPGFKEFDVSTWFGVFGPAALPRPILDRLNRELTTALRSPALRDLMAKQAAEPAPTTPEQFAQLVARENKKYEIVVKRSGAKLE